MTNEEKYRTPEERNEAFSRFCEGANGCSTCPLGKTLPTIRCHFRWLAQKAEDEKPLPCPFCGCDSIDIFKTDFGQNEEPYQFAVKCKSCGALVSAEDRNDAIAAWNRRAK